MTYCFVFICQGGRLEWMACLLAASLKRHLRCDYELIAAIPQDTQFTPPKQSSLAFLQSTDARLIGINNPINPDYAIGNKLACIDVDTDAEKLIFLDSDILCTREFAHEQQFEEAAFLAKLTDLADLPLHDWKKIYHAMNQSFPEQLYQSTVTQELMPLCFNAGFLAVDTNVQFGEQWITIAKHMQSIPNLPGTRPFLDQISLPFALQRSGLSMGLLSEAYNFPAEIRPVIAENLPFYSHYHHLSYLLSEASLTQLIQQLVIEQPLLRDVRFPEPLMRLLNLPSS